MIEPDALAHKASYRQTATRRRTSTCQCVRIKMSFSKKAHPQRAGRVSLYENTNQGAIGSRLKEPVGLSQAAVRHGRLSVMGVL